MNNLEIIRDRYRQDALSIRLGGLAANLARAGSFSNNPANRDVVHGLIEESKYFIEWSAAETDSEVATQLVEWQVQLARWQQNWPTMWSEPSFRDQFSRQVRSWSEKVLEISGLLDG